MIAKIFFVHFCLHHLAIAASESQRPYKIEFTNITSYSFADLCQINSSISNAGSISMFINVQRPVPNFYAKLKIMVGASYGVYDLTLLNKTIDMCKLFNDPKYEPLVQIFYRELTRTGTFAKRCPIAKGMYFIENVFVDHRNLPLTIPFKGFRVDVLTMTKSGNTLNVACGFTIQTKIS